MKLKELSQAVKDFPLSHITDRLTVITDSHSLSLFFNSLACVCAHTQIQKSEIGLLSDWDYRMISFRKKERKMLLLNPELY